VTNNHFKQTYFNPQCFFRMLEHWVKKIARILFVILNNGYCIPTYALWMFLLHPLKTFSADLYFKIEGLFFHWLLAMVAMWSWSAGYTSKCKDRNVISGLNLRVSSTAQHKTKSKKLRAADAT